MGASGRGLKHFSLGENLVHLGLKKACCDKRLSSAGANGEFPVSVAFKEQSRRRSDKVRSRMLVEFASFGVCQQCGANY
jgi:hypothetical protein